MYKVHRPGIVNINCRSLYPKFRKNKVTFLSNGMHYICMRCVRAGQWAWETGLYVDGGAAVRKLRKRNVVKRESSTEKQTGHPHLKFLPDWFEEYCFPVM